MDKVLITLEEYEFLVKRNAELDHLEWCGVDNWSGYGAGNVKSLVGIDPWEDIEKRVKACREKIYKQA